MSGKCTSGAAIAPGIAEAVERAGGVARLGERLGVAHSQVCRWRRSGRVPAERVAAIEAATGVPRHRLRPDLFPAPGEGLAGVGFAEAQAPLAPPPPGEVRPARSARERGAASLASLAEEARSLGLDPDRVARNAVSDAIGAERNRRWAEENREAIEAHNRWVEEHGLPLAGHRMF